MNKIHITLQPSEQALVQAAAQIYGALLASRPGADPGELIDQAIADALLIAHKIDQSVVSDRELA